MTRSYVVLAAAAVVALCSRAGAEEVQRLPALGIDPGGISVSGISSGGYMAGQVHVAHSADIMGAAVLAAGPYFCAGGGYPFNLTTALTSCSDFEDLVPFLGPPDVAPSLAEVQEQAAQRAIDDPGGLKGDRVWLFTGTLDELVPSSVVVAAQQFYEALVAPDNIELVDTVPAAHAMVTTDFGKACDAFAAPYINDCDYDAAGELLQHIYGPLAPPVEPVGALLAFDQSEFFAEESASLAGTGYLYVPKACAGSGAEAGGAQCRLHVAFHGCRQFAESIGDAFYAHAGYNDWAEANGIVVLYPQTTAFVYRLFGVSLMWPNPRGCWDWWGYTGDNYYLKSGVQIRAVKAMIDRLATRQPPQ